jgi:predicted enzyme related to lactoylglutathione lyase
MIKGFTFVELPVKNLDKAIPFYQDTLGLRLAHMDDVRKWCLLKVPGSSTGCALYECKQGSINVDSNNSVHIVIQVENVERTVETLCAHGIETEAIRVHEDEGFRISGFLDPEGHVWRIWTPFACNPKQR